MTEGELANRLRELDELYGVLNAAEGYSEAWHAAKDRYLERRREIQASLTDLKVCRNWNLEVPGYLHILIPMDRPGEIILNE